MLDIFYSSRFKKDYRRAVRRGANPALLEEVVGLLQSRQPLPQKYQDHPLGGDYEGFRECHIQPDWLLVYRVDEGRLLLVLFRTGTHSDLF